MRWNAFKSVAGLAILFVAWGAKAEVSESLCSQAASANNAFAFDIYRRLASQPGNLFFSPEIDGLSSLEQTLDNVQMTRLLAQMEPREVSVFLPKFKIVSEFSLNGALQAMGMADAFSLERADFSGMAGGLLYIHAALQQAYVDVDEKGTEATAPSALSLDASEPPIPPPPLIIKVDHPFLFLIWHNETGAILFLGRVTNP